MRKYEFRKKVYNTIIFAGFTILIGLGAISQNVTAQDDVTTQVEQTTNKIDKNVETTPVTTKFLTTQTTLAHENTTIEKNNEVKKRNLNNVKKVSVKSYSVGNLRVDWTTSKKVSGYVIEYSKSNKFRKNTTKKIRIKNRKIDNANVYDLKSNSIYYVRIRTFKKNKKKTLYSDWSKPKKTKIASIARITKGKTLSSKKYFKKSVFFGDSVMLGFQYYMENKPSGYLDNAKVFGVGCYSTRWALIKNTQYQPFYNGRHVPPQYVVKGKKAKKVFLFLGINDLAGHSTDPKQVYGRYIQVINNIKKMNKGVTIHVISATNGIRGSRDAAAFADRTDRLNDLMKEYCNNTDCEYIDIRSYVSTSDGYLKSEYCSDGYVHQTYASYAMWDKVLRSFGYNQVKNGNK